MAPTRRERLRAELVADIGATARGLLRSSGLDGVTVAGVAERLGMTSPALYRYITNREGLLQRLSEDLAAEFVGHLRGSVARHAAADLRTRLESASYAYRDWAVANPEEFRLLYMTPPRVFGERWDEVAAQRLVSTGVVYAELFTELWAERPYPVEADDALGPALRDEVVRYGEAGGVPLPPGALVVFIHCFYSFHGAVCVELQNWLAPAIADHGPLYRDLIAKLLTRLGLDPAPE